MTMLTDVDIGSGASVSPRTTSASTTTTTGTPTSTPSAMSPSTARSSTASRTDSVTADGAAGRDRHPQGRARRPRRLLDVPRIRGVAWLEPGEHVFREDLEAAERDQGVRVGTGDILLVRTGHTRRQAELEPWDTGKAKAGLHPTTASFLAERQVAALGLGRKQRHRSQHHGGDRVSHPRLAINAMGIHLLDYLQFEDLVRHCEAERAGSSCSWPPRSESPAGPGRRSTRPRSSDRAGDTSKGARPARDARVVGEPRWPMAAAVPCRDGPDGRCSPTSNGLLPAWLLPADRGHPARALIAVTRARSTAARGCSAALRVALVIDARAQRTGGHGPADRRPDQRRHRRRTRPATLLAGGRDRLGGEQHRVRAALLGARRRRARLPALTGFAPDPDFAFPQQMNPELAPRGLAPAVRRLPVPRASRTPPPSARPTPCRSRPGPSSR